MPGRKRLYPSPSKDNHGYTIRQPNILGFPVSYNPDTNHFCLHDKTEDGEHGGDILAMATPEKRGWSNLITRTKELIQRRSNVSE